jgi:Phosphotransferase enzyme family
LAGSVTSSILIPEFLNWIEKSFGEGFCFLNATPLHGATTAALFDITLEHSGQHEHCVLRLFTDAEWLRVEPDLPIHEAGALEFVSTAGLPTPRLIAVDEKGSLCGVPALLMTRLPGKVDLISTDMEGWLRQQAEFLFHLHALENAAFPWNYRPYVDLGILTVPPSSPHADWWQRAIEIVHSPAPLAPTCFIHRDYHPVNLLWQHGHLSGVVDWVNACRGPAGIDVGWCRHNLACAYGVPLADRFLAICQSVCGSTWSYHPYWDLVTLMDMLPGPFKIYPPWLDFGLSNLTDAIFDQRVDEYLHSLLVRF